MFPELVCIVDDDQSMRRSLQRLFKSAGYSAEIFASAEDYLAREVFDGPSCLARFDPDGKPIDVSRAA